MSVSEYSDAQLLASLAAMRQAEAKRDVASKHDKFNKDTDKSKKMEFPTINPAFNSVKNEIISEMNKRNLKEGW